MATKEQRRDRLARGLCVNCSSKPPIKNETLCVRCKEQKKKHHRKYLDKKRENKICLYCSSPVQENKALCLECTEKRKQKYSYEKKPPKPKKAREKRGTILFDQVFDVERRILKNFIGKKFNHLEVIDFSHQIKYMNYWICRCDCDELRIVAQNHLKNIISCGCKNLVNNIKVIDKKTFEVRYKKVDYTGKIFGKYKVTGYSHLVQKNNFKDNYWECKCIECGNEKIISVNQLKNGSFADCKCDNTVKVTLRELMYDLIKRAKEKTLKLKEIQVLDQSSGKMVTINNDLTGKRFGNLLVLEFSYKLKKMHKWLCQCDCGTIDIYTQTNLIERKVTHCGCKGK